ncbi:hypothetical protein [Parahaliea mediterranea]|uniref:DODA-type extradiol aromatic ring-opening family dioxygenase n=1 Tax=Parahaliea mediterranea TaxID=651086 RepID=UPI0019D463D8|nr:hypothetical protein [Parahaliea mediterranea]
MTTEASQQLIAGTESKIVAAFGMTHTPGLGNLLSLPPAGQVKNILSGFDEARRLLARAQPDIILALVNDHFDMSSMDNMPAFSVSVADQHYGPPAHLEDWIQLERAPIAGHREYARTILEMGIAAGFDITRWGSAELVHNVLLPMRFLRPERDIPVVPIFTNCFVPPCPTLSRCFDLGQMLGQVIAERPEKVAIIASGGISHWPPFVNETEEPLNEFEQRMLEAQRAGPGGMTKDPKLSRMIAEREMEMAATRDDLINVDWDRRVLNALAQGDKETLLGMSYEDIYHDAGNGGYEMALWVMMMGALNCVPGRTLFYEPVKEWMGGVSVLSYDNTLAAN